VLGLYGAEDASITPDPSGIDEGKAERRGKNDEV